MPIIPNRHEFEPDENALKTWLFTRKREESSAMATRPGLFSTLGFAADQFWFILAIVLELIGMSLLISNGLKLGSSQFAMIAVLGAIALFLIDLFLAYKLHRNEDKKCLARNRIRLEGDPKKKEMQRDILKEGKFVDFLIIVSMILIALIKLAGIIFLGTFDHLAIIISLLVMFALIVYVHVKHTGYYIYEKLTERAFKKQFKQHVYDQDGAGFGKARLRNSTFSYISGDLLGKDREELVGNSGHIIKKNGQKEDGTFEYTITTKGILIDEDVSAFINNDGLDNDRISKIASVCLAHQVEMVTGKNF